MCYFPSILSFYLLSLVRWGFLYSPRRVFYLGIALLTPLSYSTIAIGFSGPRVTLNRLPGWESESWAYHGDDGHAFCCTHSGKEYGPKYSTLDVIGCGVNFRTGCAFYTKNGVYLGTAFKDIRHERLYPSVGMKKPGEHLRVNFGQTPFVFDIDSMVEKERRHIQEEINKTSVERLNPPLGEDALIHQLVAQYLAHDGYVETAKAFAAEVRTESQALAEGSAISTKNLEPEEDVDAINRQKIRIAILQGDIDRALKLTNTYFPTVLRDNENIYFKLKCRKFIEMIRRCADLHDSPIASKRAVPRAVPAASNGHTPSDPYEDVFDHQMELDEQLGASPNGSRAASGRRRNGPGPDLYPDAMDVSAETSTAIPREVSHNQMLSETIGYGQQLMAEFQGDVRREVRRALDDTFALIAYPDPRESPVAELMAEGGRGPVAEELNGAVLGMFSSLSPLLLLRLRLLLLLFSLLL
ncbi:SPRY-domain-containing protein [Eremomyces bilateralis CBS 781.70]|uniref:SPRY-domain-containing protein n=1 Tax=Eremomyces bilateralis CBS 781.70 TaxID=1392243 RepID=A0A6G1G6L2_9PEZI|nr:SPRY-domain-containing protein [Eremomyces bilateralis CBS 781.70]KAF1813678.1 SPRY-domain-containing protein [Eremomyces bilateralis CBS 781.70]